jgi:two-component system, NarL family, invasion response regulator UvrY
MSTTTTSRQPLRILIADDHSIVRKGLRQMLCDAYPDAEIGEAANGAEINKQLAQGGWRILVMDINMPGRDGLEVLDDLRRDKNPIPVLILSMHSEEQMAVRALRSGASGYLSKSAASEELVNAVNRLLEGRKYISSIVAEQLSDNLERPDEEKVHARLSNREFQTAKLLAVGKTVGQIAQELSLSVPTVSTFRARILEKMGLRTTAELISYAYRHNLVA